MAKEITVKTTYKGREHLYTGTIEYLVKNVFGYHLECGNSWNHKINTNPKTGPSLVKALNAAEEEVRGGCFNRTYYELVG